MKTLLTVALTSHIVQGLDPVGIRIWRTLEPFVAQGYEPDSLSELAEGSLLPSDAKLVKDRLDAITDFEEALSTLARSGIVGISVFDPAFPQRVLDRLGPKVPPLLFVVGEADLLNHSAIGAVGSRDVDEPGVEFAEEIAREAVANGYGIVSGGARGVDQVTMMAALSAGGVAINYLSDSLTKAMKAGPMQEALEGSRVCFATPFAPAAGFSVANAMSRNKLIYAHAQATVVVTSALNEGGTWAGATEAISLGLTPVLVRSGEGVPPGNEGLIRKGGTPIKSPYDLQGAISLAAPMQGTLM